MAVSCSGGSPTHPPPNLTTTIIFAFRRTCFRTTLKRATVLSHAGSRLWSN